MTQASPALFFIESSLHIINDTDGLVIRVLSPVDQILVLLCVTDNSPFAQQFRAPQRSITPCTTASQQHTTTVCAVDELR